MTERNMAVNASAKISVMNSTVLYSASLSCDLGRKRVRPVSKPNRERVKTSAAAEIAAVASPIVVDGMVRAATIQNSRPKKEENTALSMIAKELR